MGSVVLDEKRYGRLLAEALPAVIKTEESNSRMSAAVEALMDKGDERSLEEDCLLELMAKLVMDFENSQASDWRTT